MAVEAPFTGRRAVSMLAPLLLLLAGAAHAGFVTRSGSQLQLDGKPFYFVGFNSVWLIEAPTSAVDELFSKAQGLGLKVGRVWAFNSKLPAGPDSYDEAQFKHLDYIVASAGKRNLKLVLALGNLWNAYMAPEDFLKWATGSSAGKTILDFYQDPATRALYKRHISTILNRVNTVTGVAYRADPAIMGWDVLNEPRCPACLDSQVGWMSEMAAHTKALASQQLVLSGTEGFFVPESGGNYYLLNPGAGAQCEGENSVKINSLGSIDVGTVHLYERHMELRPPSWTFCDFPCLMAWMPPYLRTHVNVAAGMGKPLVIEESGITTRSFSDPSARKVWLQHILDTLVASKQAGQPLMGVMFWQAALSSLPDWDGYNIYLDGGSAAGRKLLRTSESVTSVIGGSFGDEAEQGLMRRIVGLVTGQGGGQAVAREGRQLRVVQEELDPFRRGPQRQACASANAAVWRPSNDSAPASLLQELRQRTGGKDLLAIIREAAGRVA